MANGGRPVERPVQLTPEQRRRAQEQTAEWRNLTGLSQSKLADKVGVGHSTYRTWENSKEPNAGPTRLSCEQLNRTLRQLLGNRYRDGDAFELWGWPREWEMRYERVVELLRTCGFIVPDLPEPPAALPSTMFWVHRLRDPNLVHGVFSLAAAAATRAGMSVHLVLDDMALPANMRRGMRTQFEAAVRRWLRFAGGDDGRLSTEVYSASLSGQYQTERGWSAVIDYLNGDCQVLELLLASKIVSPLEYSTDAEESVLAIVRHAESLKANRLLTPLRNWLVFDKQIAALLEPTSGREPTSIVTLGGEDERILWELWHRGCADALSDRVEHIYLRPIPIPSYRSPWQEPALAAGASRSALNGYLRSRTIQDRHSDMIEWFLRTAVQLPASLSESFRSALDPALRDINALPRSSSDEKSAAAGLVAAAVVEWLNRWERSSSG
jgi:transcriptional regulator with XRE-family HTH domain